MKKGSMHITIISIIIGFMLAVQYKTVQNTEKLESTDLWTIRQQLSDEKNQYSHLLKEISEANGVIQKYEEEEHASPEIILSETLTELKQQIGTEAVEGPGLELKISPSAEAIAFGFEIKEIPPLLLIRLVNDIYRYNGLYIEIDGQRIHYNSAIRDINGRTTINGVPISNNDSTIKIIGDDEEDINRLYNYLLASSFTDEFYIDNLTLEIEEPKQSVKISSSNVQVKTEYLQETKGD